MYAIKIPNSLTYIEDKAFKDCIGLKKVYTNSIEAWLNVGFGGSDANPLTYAHRLFANRCELTQLNIPDGIQYIKHHSFTGCKSLEEVTIPKSVKWIGMCAFSKCSNLRDITINEGVETIREYAFSKCVNISRLIIPNSVTTIGHCAFKYCSSLSDIKLPDGLKYISTKLFYNCKSLTHIDIPKGCLTIGEEALSHCNLYGINIPEGVSTICCESFRYNLNLSNAILPSTIKSIGTYAFDWCIELSSIKLKSDTPPCCRKSEGWIRYADWKPFSISRNYTIYVPEQSVELYKKSNGWKDYSNKITGYNVND